MVARSMGHHKDERTGCDADRNMQPEKKPCGSMFLSFNSGSTVTAHLKIALNLVLASGFRR
jgi:hypothetical protein